MVQKPNKSDGKPILTVKRKVQNVAWLNAMENDIFKWIKMQFLDTFPWRSCSCYIISITVLQVLKWIEQIPQHFFHTFNFMIEPAVISAAWLRANLVPVPPRFGWARWARAPAGGSCAPPSSTPRPSSSRMRWEPCCWQSVRHLAKEFCAFCHPIR